SEVIPSTHRAIAHPECIAIEPDRNNVLLLRCTVQPDKRLAEGSCITGKSACAGNPFGKRSVNAFDQFTPVDMETIGEQKDMTEAISGKSLGQLYPSIKAVFRIFYADAD